MRFTILLAALLLIAPLAGAHVFNHEDKHETCEVYGAPQDHHIGDGHAHTHDPVAGAAMHNHDPCKQIRMDYPDYEHHAPLHAVDPTMAAISANQTVFDDGDQTNTEVFVSGEAYQFPIPPSDFREQRNLIVIGDLAAAGMGFPGTGTSTDPYIIEGYLITGTLLIRDTDACFVVRNNVIVDEAAEAPLLPDPEAITELADLDATYQALKDQAEALIEELESTQLDFDLRSQQFDAAAIKWQTNASEYHQKLADYEAQKADWEAEFAAYEGSLLDSIVDTQAMVDAFESKTDRFVSVQQPTKPHTQYIDATTNTVTNLSALAQSYESYQQDVEADGQDDDLEGWVKQTKLPAKPPSDWTGSKKEWAQERKVHRQMQNDLLDAIQADAQLFVQPVPDEAAYEKFQQDHEALQAEFDAFTAAYQAWQTQYDAFQADRADFTSQYQAKMPSAHADIDLADGHFAKSDAFLFEYAGDLGTLLYNDVDNLLDYVAEEVFDILDVLDPHEVADNSGQMILNWNGQCVHVYNNVVNDLRVNQNNDRTGYATGGIIEDNRIFTIGQIRHYDGIFRDNEVGNRAHLLSLVDDAIDAPTARTINNDGANQGWYYDNLIYGRVDLDFHGHHHSAGFFAPESHYHGSDHSVAYMKNADGSCKSTHADVDHHKANGPHEDYPTDNNIDALGETVVDLPDKHACLPHMDHGKRWTSVFFNDNIIIDPEGIGLRFEDRNHRGDDEQANSENMKELKQPHFHQKWVQLEDNVVVGKIFIDVLNAEGTLLWNDDWSAVKSGEGPARTLEALRHPGAEVVSSHPYRNDAWLDVNNNTIFQTQAHGVLVNDAKELTLFQLKENKAIAMPTSFQDAPTAEALLTFLKSSGAQNADDLADTVDTWNGADPGTQTFATLMNLRDAFRVEHCDNVARGLDLGLVATNRIYDDGNSIIAACGTNDWGTASQGVAIRYTAVAADTEHFTDDIRPLTEGTDAFYADEYAYDRTDAAVDPLVGFAAKRGIEV